MLYRLIGAASAITCLAAPTHAGPLLRGGYPCALVPPGASQECRDCMDDACDTYQAEIDACGSNTACKQAAKAAYELRLAACVSCNPAFSHRAGILIAVLPESQRRWVLDQVLSIDAGTILAVGGQKAG